MFINEGAYVFILGRSQEKLDKAKSKLGKYLYTIQGDVSYLPDLDKLYGEVATKFDHIDVVMVNAGVALLAKTQDVTEENYDFIFDINIKGAFFTAQKALPLLKSGSSVIFTSSTAAHLGETGNVVYSGSKLALTAFARTFSAEHAKNNIRFNTISPTIIHSPISEYLFSNEQLKYWAEKHPPKRLGKLEDFLGAVKFLASKDSAFIYGQDLLVDGGRSNTIELIESLT